jgi:hypothetical protein
MIRGNPMPARINPPKQYNPEEPHAGVMICADIPLDPKGSQPLDYYKRIAVSNLAQQIIHLIEPELIELDGFEVMRYPVVVVRNGDDGRNESGINLVV